MRLNSIQYLRIQQALTGFLAESPEHFIRLLLGEENTVRDFLKETEIRESALITFFEMGLFVTCKRVSRSRSTI